MKLEQWLSNTQTSRSAFAERIGVSKSVVTKWCSGEVLPRTVPLLAIYRVTAGQVSPNDFYDLSGLTACNDDDPAGGRCAIEGGTKGAAA
ncbi:hypothetical protein TMES_09845 [Thalassospira mesophila]|uniref:HTH cro/C1-type domain-containing protein n=2 Tax=Thalassospira mesophila TaxID=1293891 RepID=A0A1Y2L175_9PROT|nr:hypothetical protein TMES_09845 [Thalassospira mesophila]